MPQITDRQRLWLPLAVYAPCRSIAATRRHSLATLAWVALRDGVRTAMRGGEPPLATSVPAVPPRWAGELRWTQRNDEYQRWTQVLLGANSSPLAVIYGEFAAYVASDGDVAGVGDPVEDLVYA